jgi:hypothetical protein
MASPDVIICVLSGNADESASADFAQIHQLIDYGGGLAREPAKSYGAAE